MANPILKYGEDGETFAVQFPDGSECEPQELSDSGISLLDDTDPNVEAFLVLTSAYGGGLKPNTVYQLVALETGVETDVEFDEDDEDEDDDEAGDESEEVEG